MDNNRANQLNPNNWRFWTSRGYSGRPDDWAGRSDTLVFTKEWLDKLPPLISAVSSYAFIASTCLHGIAKGACFLCTLQGAVISFGVASIAILYWNYPEQLKEHALKSCTTTGSLCRSSARFLAENSVSLANYSLKLAKEQGPKVWNYGVVVPAKFAKDQGPNVWYYGVVAPAKFAKDQGTNVWYYGVVVPAKFAKDQGPNAWYYGVAIPYSAAKTGAQYSGQGLAKLASKIGYYCGSSGE